MNQSDDKTRARHLQQKQQQQQPRHQLDEKQLASKQKPQQPSSHARIEHSQRTAFEYSSKASSSSKIREKSVAVSSTGPHPVQVGISRPQVRPKQIASSSYIPQSISRGSKMVVCQRKQGGLLTPTDQEVTSLGHSSAGKSEESPPQQPDVKFKWYLGPSIPPAAKSSSPSQVQSSTSSSSTKSASSSVATVASPSSGSTSKKAGLKTSKSSKSVLDKFRRLPIPRRENPRSSLSPPITPESKSDSTAYATFSFGSDSETEESTASPSYPTERALGGFPEDTVVVTRVTSSSATSMEASQLQKQKQRERKRDRNKLRFKKILRPIRRSHSAGCAKDVPAHALFLKHQESVERGERHSVDTGRGGSMEGSDTESDTDTYTPDKHTGGTPAKPKKKSLAQEMKDKLAFLRRRHTDTSISGKEGERPTPQVALDWSKSFDNLLNDRYGLELFRDFLRTEFSEENIEFWIACEEYKSIKPTNLTPMAQRIYTDYVAIQAPREVNLDSKTRLKTIENLDNPDRETFEVAQKRIQALMAKDSYPRFLQSAVYQDLLGEYKHKLKLKT